MMTVTGTGNRGFLTTSSPKERKLAVVDKHLMIELMMSAEHQIE